MGNCCCLPCQERAPVVTSPREQQRATQWQRQYGSFAPVNPTVYLPQSHSEEQYEPLWIVQHRPIPSDRERKPVVTELQKKQINQVQERKTSVATNSQKEQNARVLKRSKELPTAVNSKASTSKRIEIAPAIIKDFLRVTGHETWNHFTSNNCAYRQALLAPNSEEFKEVKKKFCTTNKKFYKVTEIRKVINPYLFIQYKLMEILYKQRYEHVHEQTLFHGTSIENVDNICRYNFNWRLYGRKIGHKYGKGVSFTPIAYYATHYSDKIFDKVVIVVKVLRSKHHVGKDSTVLPRNDCDTTTNYNEHVFVKYEDNTFYPSYVIHYQGIDWDSKDLNNRD